MRLSRKSRVSRRSSAVFFSFSEERRISVRSLPMHKISSVSPFSFLTARLVQAIQTLSPLLRMFSLIWEAYFEGSWIRSATILCRS